MTDAASLVAGAKQWASHYGDFANGDEGAVLTVPLRVRGAFDRNDADGLADVFVDNGSYLAGDNQLTSREEIRAYFTEAFAGELQGASVHEEPKEIKFLAPDVAVAITEGGIVKQGETELAPEKTNRIVWIVVKEGGDWQLFSHQTSPLKG